MTLVLARDGQAHEHWDEMHKFRLTLVLAGWPGPLEARGECVPRFTDRPVAGVHDPVSVTTTTLHCGIDCDGGLMEVERVAGTGAVVFRFDPRGLRMTDGCSGRQAFHVGAQTKPLDEASRAAHRPVAFQLTPASARACNAARIRAR